MARKRKGRSLDGVIIIDKDAGMSSNAVVQKAKRLFDAAKAGHTGALDPLATGVLPVCFGESTKFSQYLLNADKSYTSTFVLGEATDTCDSEGEVELRCDASALTQSDIERAMAPFYGEIDQVPPMYSALKRDGQPLYKLARKGETVERPPRRVTLHRFDLLRFEPGERALIEVEIECSKGTYVRSLADDLGRALGVGGHVSVLRRTRTGPFELGQSHTLEALTTQRGNEEAKVLDPRLLPVDAAIQDMWRAELDIDSAHYFLHGHPVMDVESYRHVEEGGTVRVFRADGQFLGLGEVTEDGRIAPKRLIATAPPGR